MESFFLGGFSSYHLSAEDGNVRRVGIDEPEKVRRRPSDPKSDYTLWRILVTYELDAHILTDALRYESVRPDNKSEKKVRDFGEKQGLTTDIVIRALTDKQLRVMRSVTGSPCLM